MSVKLNDSGERMIPQLHKGHNKYGAHLIRYQAALDFVDNKVVLDIACGSGYGAKLLAAKAKKVFGIDISEDSIKYAKDNYSANSIEFKVGDCLAIPLDDKSVDIVVSYETIEHLSGYRKFMQEIKRVLKPEGTLLLSTPNKMESAGGNPFHFREFSYDQAKSLTKEYFTYSEDYLQTLWLYNSLLPPKLHSGQWQEMIKTIKTIALEPTQSEFFIMVCSDNKPTTNLRPLGAMSEYYRQHLSPEREIANLEKQLSSFKKQLAQLEKQAKRTRILEQELGAIKSSKAWRLASLMQSGSAAVRKQLKSK